MIGVGAHPHQFVEHGLLPHEKAVKDRGDKGLEQVDATGFQRIHAGAGDAAESPGNEIRHRAALAGRQLPERHRQERQPRRQCDQRGGSRAPGGQPRGHEPPRPEEWREYAEEVRAEADRIVNEAVEFADASPEPPLDSLGCQCSEERAGVDLLERLPRAAGIAEVLLARATAGEIRAGFIAVGISRCRNDGSNHSFGSTSAIAAIR